MKVIILCQKSEFNQASVDEISKYVPVTWLNNDKLTFPNIKPLVSDDEEKLIAISPVPFDWVIPNEIYSIPKLQYLCLPTTSYEFIDTNICQKAGITITNVPYYSTEAVAEYSVFLMMSLLKRLPQQIRSGFKYEFTNDNLMDELVGKKVGIVGLGHIGQRIAEITKSLGMEVYYWSLTTRDDRFQYLDLEKLISSVEIVFPTVIADKNTKGLLNKELLSKTGDHTYFISLIGEEVWDKNYLITRANNNKLAGLAFESDKVKTTDFTSNIFVTAPLAWYTKQSLENDIKIWKETIISCVQGKPINRVV